MAYRYECMKSMNIIKNEPYEVMQVNFYEKEASKKEGAPNLYPFTVPTN